MKKYKVMCTEIIEREIEVMANSPQEAFEAVALGVDNNDNSKILDDTVVDSEVQGPYIVSDDDEENNQTRFYI